MSNVYACIYCALSAELSRVAVGRILTLTAEEKKTVFDLVFTFI